MRLLLSLVLSAFVSAEGFAQVAWSQFSRADGANLRQVTQVAQSADSTSYLPFAVGNLWRYRATDGDPYVGWPIRIRVYDTLRVGGCLYWVMDALGWKTLGVPDTVRLDSSGTLWHLFNGLEEPLVRFSATVGEQWTYSYTSRDQTLALLVAYVGERDSVRLSVEPLQTMLFRHVKVFHSELSGIADAWKTDWYAPGFGRIFQGRSINYDVLYGFTIDSITVGDTTATSVRENQSLSTSFQLEQNYPNPFNPTTRIRYTLSQRCNVHLAIFNTLGQQVAELTNREMGAGLHEIVFDASPFPAGAYFYRLQAGPSSITKVMALLK